MSKRPLIVVLLAFSALAAGCGGARNVTISMWQRNLEQYVQKHGRGDPIVLRDLTLPDERRGYAVLGADRPAESTDAYGVLLGHRSVNDRQWFFYLVGLVKRQQVEEIRLAAFSVDSGDSDWKVGRDDEEAMKKYRQYNRELAAKRFPGRPAPPPEYLGFPRPEDVFELRIEGTMVIAAHRASGAQWELKLPSPSRQIAGAD